AVGTGDAGGGGTASASESSRLTTDLAHIVAQVLITVCAMALVYLALYLAIHRWDAGQKIQSTDVVAIMGAVTTFLGTAIGLFFGVSAGQAGKRSADDAA